jgi:ribose 5-phosphate isomerase B
MEKIFLASDHAGFGLKNKIKEFLETQNYTVIDKGSFEYNEEDDYPDFVALVAREVSKNPKTKAIIVGGSGQGEAMVANRFPNVRATVYYRNSLKIIQLSRKHNNANVLSLGARFLSLDQALKAIKVWLKTEFTKEKRHVRRIKKIEKIV